MADLIHFSKDPLLTVDDTPQTKRSIESRDKPDGLWVSVEDGCGWSDFCRSEQWGSCNFANKIQLAEDANLLWIRNDRELLEFNDKWVLHKEYPRNNGIRWPDLAIKYDGIFIVPYSWDLRLDNRLPWYYGWDCSSGCIWHARAIKDIQTSPYSFQEAA